MGLMNEQAQFAADVCLRLYPFIHSHGIDAITFGEVKRTREQQEIYLKQGRSTTANSMHLSSCAVDFNMLIRENGSFKLQADKKALQPIFDYWESLDPKNRAGGNFEIFYDSGHFERRV